MVDDGAAIAKFWIHLSKKELKRRLNKLEDDTLQAWRVRPEDWKQAKKYEEYTTLAEEMVAQPARARTLDASRRQLSTLGESQSFNANGSDNYRSLRETADTICTR